MIARFVPIDKEQPSDLPLWAEEVEMPEVPLPGENAIINAATEVQVIRRLFWCNGSEQKVMLYVRLYKGAPRV